MNENKLQSQMTPVKSQPANCENGYGTYALTAQVEYWSRKNGSNKIFSEQYIFDCQTGNRQASLNESQSKKLTNQFVQL